MRPAAAKANAPRGAVRQLGLVAPLSGQQRGSRARPLARHRVAVVGRSLEARVMASAMLDPKVAVGTQPTGVAVSATRAYVANQGSNSVSVIDLSQNPPVVVATVAVGSGPDAVALSADGARLFASNYFGGTASVIDTATNVVTKTVVVGSRPTGILEVGGLVYVACLSSHSVSVFDPAQAAPIATAFTVPATGATLSAPSGLAASADGHTLYVNDARNGKTFVFDLTQNPPVSTGEVVNGAGTFPAYLAVAGTIGYSANPGTNSIRVLDLVALTATNVPVGGSPYGVVALPSLGEAFAANSGTDDLTVIDTAGAPTALAPTVATGDVPDAIAVGPDLQTAVVSNEGEGTVSIFHVNQPPTNTVPGAQSMVYNATAATHHTMVFSGGIQISTSDADAAASASPLKVTLGVAHGTLTLAQTTGLSFVSGANGQASMTFTGLQADVNAALNGLVYEPASPFFGADALSLTVDDQGSTGLGKPQATTSSVAISVSDTTPTDIALSPASVNENQPAATTVGSFSTTDADGGDVFSYSLVAGTGDSDNGSFQIVGGTLQTNAAFDFESKSSYSIRVRSTDAGGLFFEKVFTVTINNVNEAPAAQNQTVTTNEDTPVTITLIASDPESGALTFKITALPAAGTGTLHAGATIAAPVITTVPTTLPGNQVTYEPPLNANGAAFASFQFVANDGALDSAAASVTANVTAVNDAPVLGGVELSAVGYIESLNPAPPGESQLTSAITVSDVDNTSLASATVQITGGYQSGQDVLGYIAPAGNPITGSFNASTATLTLTGPGTLVQWQAALRAVTYKNTSDTPNTSPRTVSFTVSDGSLASNVVTRTITVTPTNDPPVGAANYSHAVTGNVRIQVGPTLLTGVTDPEGDALTAQRDATSAEVGNVTINANGSYVYNPKAGREGADSVKYKICDNGVPVQCSTVATLTLNVSGMLWFINSAAGAGGDGRLTTPFNTLAAFNTLNNSSGDNPAAGDNIFLYTGSYTGPLTLLNTQKLMGQGASATVTTISGLTLAPDSDALPATGGTAPTLTNASGNVVNLAQNNTLRGIAIGNRSGIGINGSSFGTLTFANDVSITGTGQAIVLATGTLAGSFATVSGSTATGSVVSLTAVAGPFSASGGSITTSAGATAGFFADGGADGITYPGTISAAGGRPVQIQNKTGGTVAFSAAVSSTASGILLSSNTGATINFTGGVTLNGGANLSATGGGTVSVTGSSNTIGATTPGAAPALNVVSTTIGASGLTFLSISANGGANGIVLNTTGANGGLSVTGTGTTGGSGGTIQNITSRGASFINTRDVTLKNMNFSDVGTTDGADPTVQTSGCGALDVGNNLSCSAGIHLVNVTNVTLDRLALNNDNSGNSAGQEGINGNNVTNFTLSNSSVLNFGNAINEDGLRFLNLLGTVSIAATTVSGNEANQAWIQNTTGTVTVTVSGNSTFSSSTQPNGGHGIEFYGTNAATMNLDVQSGTQFTNIRSIGIQAIGQNNAQLTVKVNASTFTNTGSAGMDISNKDSADTKFNVTNNTMTGQGATAINVNLGGAPTGTQNATLQGNISGNNLSPLSGAPGISLDGNTGQVGQGGSVTATVTNNQISITAGSANSINALVGDGAAILNATITNNTVTSSGGATGGDFFLESAKITTDTSTACMEVSGNNIPNNTGSDLLISQRFGSTFRVRNFTGSTTINAFLASQNTLNGGTVLAEGTYLNTSPAGSQCPQPVLP